MLLLEESCAFFLYVINETLRYELVLDRRRVPECLEGRLPFLGESHLLFDYLLVSPAQGLLDLWSSDLILTVELTIDLLLLKIVILLLLLR